MRSFKAFNLARQRGAALLFELAIVTIISTAMIASGVIYERNKVVDQLFSAQGDLMNTLKGAVSTYIANNYQALVNGTGVAGVANPYAPTIAELQNPAVSPLPAGFSATSLFGIPYVVTIAKSPAGCVAPACDITGMAYINGAPLNTSNGKVDGSRLGIALNQIGGDGAVSDSMDPATVYGIGGQFNLPNPAGNVAGILAVRTGFGSSAFSQFLRRDGSLPMTGNLKMGNQDIVGAGGAFFAGGTNAKSVNVGNNAVFFGDSSNAAIRTTGGLYIQNMNGTGPADISQVGNITAGGAISANGSISSGNNINASGNITANNNMYAKSGQFSVDGWSTCCSPSTPTLAVSENTASTGRSPSIQFHAAGYSEGYITLATSGPRRLLFRDNQGSGLGIDTNSTVTANAVVLPTGNSLNIGGSYYYGDGSNLALRPNGGDVYFQRANGGLSNIPQVGAISASGTVSAPIFVANGDWWSILGHDSGGNDNVAPQSAAGSGYFNDIYIRSIGKWASQLGQANITYSTDYQIPGGTGAYYFGAHKMCAITGIQNGNNTNVGNAWNYLQGSWNGSWQWNTYGHVPDFAKVTCYD